MNHTDLIKNTTKAYTIAYNQAMEDVRNPNMAAQIASVVTMSYMTAFKQEAMQEQQAQTMLGIMLSMVNEVKKQEDKERKSAGKKRKEESSDESIQ